MTLIILHVLQNFREYSVLYKIVLTLHEREDIYKMFGIQSQIHSWMFLAAFSHQLLVVVEGLTNNHFTIMINIHANVFFALLGTYPCWPLQLGKSWRTIDSKWCQKVLSVTH